MTAGNHRGQCKVCTDPRRGEIDAALLLGKTVRAIAHDFGLRRATVGRHSKFHVKEMARKSLERVSLAYSRHLRMHMERIQEQTLQIITSAKASGNLELALAAVREGRQNSDVMRKLILRTPEGRSDSKKPDAVAAAIEIEFEEARHVAHTQ